MQCPRAVCGGTNKNTSLKFPVQSDEPICEAGIGTQIQRIDMCTHYFANKGPSSQDYGFSSGYGCESWTVKKAERRRIDAFELCLESPLDCKEIQPVPPEGDQPWDFFGRNDAKAETPVLWPPRAKS